MSETVLLDELIVPITVEYLEEDNVYKVSCPALQGCHAWGDTLDEAMRAIPGNIRAMIAARRANGSPIPPLFEHVDVQTPFVLQMVPA
jgi:predicted RNase H-like HicB family nuclease